ncbi:EAP30/Vps36 family-domain-containing protein [Rhizoctonia solani]|nr:EAP30/Vps36 family-domain-containing protein [Rhizoctonia solani]
MHRLGGAGYGAFDRQTQSLASFAALSTSLKDSEIAHLQAQMNSFRTALTRFAAQHRAQIRADPAFRTAFTSMCASLGVDPLAGPRDGGLWAELLGLGDFSFELGVQIVDVCVEARDKTGGLVDMQHLLRQIEKMRALKDGAITEDDVARSINALKPLGAGYEIVTVGGRKMVRSVPRELDTDQTEVLALALRSGGMVDARSIMVALGWSLERSEMALDNMLMRDGTCWLDDQDPAGKIYWVFSAFTFEDTVQ